MRPERRRHPRLSVPLDGRWYGASGGSSCRIGDISLTGCFVQSLAMPVPGEVTEITLKLDAQRSLVLKGSVVYAEPGMGFAVQFLPMDSTVREQFDAVLEALRSAEADEAS